MKVVLFCGGLGMRLRDYSDKIPKPLVNIGYRPILWHVMKYYAHFNHKEFILCLGYGADLIKDYFLNYNECTSNDFVLSNGGKELELLHTDITDWKVTFAYTGMTASIGERLKAVEKYLDGEDEFMANYSDGLTDLSLPDYIDHFRNHNKIASFLAVKPRLSYHLVSSKDGCLVDGITEISHTDIRVNGGYFLFKKDIFKYLREGEELVGQPFQSLIRERQLMCYGYDGFWAGMDTFKDKQLLDEMYSRGAAPWEMWKTTRLEPSCTP